MTRNFIITLFKWNYTFLHWSISVDEGVKMLFGYCNSMQMFIINTNNLIIITTVCIAYIFILCVHIYCSSPAGDWWHFMSYVRRSSTVWHSFLHRMTFFLKAGPRALLDFLFCELCYYEDLLIGHIFLNQLYMQSLITAIVWIFLCFRFVRMRCFCSYHPSSLLCLVWKL